MNQESNIRARLIVIGDVQGVNYRAWVKRIARVYKIRGVVRNLEDDKVEIFYECDEKTLQKFKRSIKKERKDSEDIFSPHVEDIKEYKEETEEYKESNPPKEFKTFNIDYGVKLSSFQEESLTKDEIGGLLLVNTRKKTMSIDEEIGGIQEGFGKVIEKYAHFSEDMKLFGENLKEMNENFKKFVEYYMKKEDK